MSKARRTSHKYRIWQHEVFKRDNYTCQYCSCKERDKLTAHHKKKYANYPKLRYKVNNGLTLCIDCHRKVEEQRAKKYISKKKE